MLNVNELEKRWLRYKIKSFLPYILLTIIFIFTIASIYLYNNTQKKEQPIIINKKKKILKIKKEIKKKVILEPSLDFMKDMKVSNKKIKQPKKKTISIVKTENKNDIDIVLKRFKENKNPSLSLFLAKRYYEQKAYKQ